MEIVAWINLALKCDKWLALDSCEHNNEPLGSTIRGDFLD